MAEKDIEQEFLKAYEDYSSGVFRYILLHSRNKNESLDVMQEAFLSTWEYLKEGKKIKSIKAFLFRTAINKLIDKKRKKRTASLDEMIQKGFDVSDDKEEKRRQELFLETENVLKQINELEEKNKSILLLRLVEEMSIKEIAETLNEKETTVSVRIHRAIARLKKNMESENKKQKNDL